MTPRVALVGANGHGRWHRRTLAALHQAGALELVALCDLAPIRDEPDAPVPPAARGYTDYRELLAEHRPDVVVICTPPHTHLAIATAAARAGADLLLEKPPLLSLAEQHRLGSVLADTGRVCQVGFQALGSAALAELLAAITGGALGRVRAVSALGAWQREDSYYQRAAWAGRRTVNGVAVLDGALANPFAHALMQCLAVAAAAGADAPDLVELERYRARPIEVDDTSVLRVRLAGALPVLVAVTLCGDTFLAGEVIVHGSAGTATLEYPTDRLRLPGDATSRHVPGRVGLIENLLAHRADPAKVPLIAPLERTTGFTALLEVMAAAPEPTTIGTAFVAGHGAGPARVVTVPGISEVMRRCAADLSLPSEFGVAWAAAAPHRVPIAPDNGVEIFERMERRHG